MKIATNSAALYNIVTDLDLTIISENHEARGLAGKKLSITGLKLGDALPGLDEPTLKDTLKQCLQTPGATQRMEMQTGVNGAMRYFTWVVCSETGLDGQPERLQWLGTETTQHLRKSRRDLFEKSLLEQFPDAVVTMTPDLAITGFNHGAEKLYGYSAEQMMGRRMTDFFAIRPVKGDDFDLPEYLQHHETWEGALLFVATDGREIVTQTKLIAVRDNNNELQGFIGIDRDITDQYRLRQTHRDQITRSELLGELLNQTGALAWAINSDGQLQYFNSGIKRLFGWDESCYGRHISELVTPEDFSRIDCQNNEVIREGKILNFVNEMNLPDGRVVYKTMKFPVHTDKGLFAACIALDISGEIKHQEELAFLKQRYELAANMDADLIGDWDIVQDRIWRNTPAANVDAHQIPAKTINDRYERLHPEDLEGFRTSLHNALYSDAVCWEYEYRYRSGRNAQEFKLLHERARILRDESGKAVRMISVACDVTEKRRLQHELEIKNKEVIMATIEGQEAERNEIARELHDNVGQILAMCNLFVDITSDTIKHEYLDKCREQLQRALREIRSISHRLSPATLDRKGLATAIADLVENINQTKKINLQLGFASDLQAIPLHKKIQTTAYRIVQECISNMLKHAEATNAFINIGLDDKLLLISVTDDGKGFDPRAVKSGIGLRNIYSRIEMAKGVARLSSEPGKGCRLDVRLPIDVID